MNAPAPERPRANLDLARGRLSPSLLNAISSPNLYLPEISRTRQTVRTLRRGIVIPHTLVSERGIGGHGRKAIRRDRSRFPPLAFFLAQRNLSAARKWPAEQPACVSNISIPTIHPDCRRDARHAETCAALVGLNSSGACVRNVAWTMRTLVTSTLVRCCVAWLRLGGRIHTREQPADSMGLTEYHADGQVGGAWTCSQLRPENRD